MTGGGSRPRLLVQLNWHRRRSGVSTHVTAICGPLGRTYEVRWSGPLRPAEVPPIALGEVLRRAAAHDVLWHAHRNNELLVGALVRLVRPRLRVIFTRHDSYPPGWFSRWVAALADVMVTLNPENAGWMGRPSVVVPHGVDTGRFRPPPLRSDAWQALGLGGAFGIGVVGRVRPNKGQADFVEAVAPLLARLPHWRGALVGFVKPGHAAWVRELQRQGGPSLALVEESQEPERWYQGLSVLVNPSHGESFGLTIIEGMASGCCVVASHLSHLPTLIEHGRTGFLYPPRDPAALREVLEPLMREPERAAAIGRNAAEEARSRFSVETECQRLSDIYEGRGGVSTRS